LFYDPNTQCKTQLDSCQVFDYLEWKLNYLCVNSISNTISRCTLPATFTLQHYFCCHGTTPLIVVPLDKHIHDPQVGHHQAKAPGLQHMQKSANISIPSTVWKLARGSFSWFGAMATQKLLLYLSKLKQNKRKRPWVINSFKQTSENFPILRSSF